MDGCGSALRHGPTGSGLGPRVLSLRFSGALCCLAGRSEQSHPGPVWVRSEGSSSGLCRLSPPKASVAGLEGS